MLETSSQPWLSGHLAINCGLRSPDCDTVVTDVVRPFVQRQKSSGTVSQWFFVRYGERGNHLRLRLRPTTRAARARLVHELVAYTRARGITRVDWVEYRPEVERYGGPRAIAVAEEFFHHSSEAAASLIDHVGELPGSARLGRAMACMLLIASAFCDRAAWAARFLRTYARSYLRSLGAAGSRLAMIEARFDKGFSIQEQALGTIVHELWASSRSGAPIAEGLDLFRVSLIETRRKFQALADAEQVVMWNRVPLHYRAAAAGVVPSYLHMMSNRLGLTIPEESYLAHVVALALERDGHFNGN